MIQKMAEQGQKMEETPNLNMITTTVTASRTTAPTTLTSRRVLAIS